IVYAPLVSPEKIGLAKAKELLTNILSRKDNVEVSLPVIFDVVARHFDIRPDDLTAPKREQKVSYPRQIAMYLCRKHIGMSLPQMGEAFGGKHYSTILYGIQKIEKEMEMNPQKRRAIEEIEKNVIGKNT
ncbi:MAG: chromosomal replication initiator protein DnaA, partial [Oscillospiraceae bacterium]|nr:chromosomal replication initiator protein DnaA [Oscillospiraceae bacterium]